MAEFPALPLFTDAFIADTIHLNAQQTGAYLMLLMAAWRTSDCRLPNDDKMLARFARMEYRQWIINKDVVMAFWRVDENGKLYQRRLVDERFRVEEKRSKNVAAGNASALKRHQARMGSNRVDACNFVDDVVNEIAKPFSKTPLKNKDTSSTDVPTEGQRKSNYPLTRTIREESILDSSPPTPKGENKGFEEFWKKFPKTRAGSKAKAEGAFTKALKRATREEIFDGLERYRGSDEVQRGFAKGAAAWLNDDRWTSDYGTKPSRGKDSQPQASYLDKLHASAKRAIDNLEARMDADRHEPWNVGSAAPARIGVEDSGEESRGQPQIADRDREEISRNSDACELRQGFDGCSDQQPLERE